MITPLGDNGTSNVESLEDILHDSDDNSVSVKSLDDAYENVVKAAQKIDKPIKNLSIIDTIIILIHLAGYFLILPAMILLIIRAFIFYYGINSIISMIIITIIVILIMVSSNKIEHILSTRIHKKFLSMVEYNSYTYGMLAELKPCMQLVKTEKYETDDFHRVLSLIKASDYNTRMPSYVMKYLLAKEPGIDYSGRLIAIIHLIREHDKEADFTSIMTGTMQLLNDTALRLFAQDYNSITNGPEPFTTAYNDMRAYSQSLPSLPDSIIERWNNTSYMPPITDDDNNNDRISYELGLDSSSNDLQEYYTSYEYKIISDNHADMLVCASSSKVFIKYFTMFVNNLQKSSNKN